MVASAHELRERLQELNGHKKAPKVSFEFFPPNTPQLTDTLWKSIDKLRSLSPEFVSVTYGADGSTRDRTHSIIDQIQRETDLPTMPHLTCVGALREEVNAIAQQYEAMGVRKIMALRGDPAEGAGGQYQPVAGGYDYAVDLVAGLKRHTSLSVGVAAYPETHPDAPSSHFDLENLQRKFDAGADFAITQFFFGTEHYLRFRDRCVLAGIDKPIIPGILPVTNFTTLKRFAGSCGTNLPNWLHQAFDGLDDDPEIRALIAANIAIEQVLALQAEGLDQFHFYTLNRAKLCYSVCHALGVRPEVANYS